MLQGQRQIGRDREINGMETHDVKGTKNKQKVKKKNPETSIWFQFVNNAENESMHIFHFLTEKQLTY